MAVYPTWQLCQLDADTRECNASNESAQIFNLFVKHVTLMMLKQNHVMLYIMSAAHTDGHLDTPPL